MDGHQSLRNSAPNWRVVDVVSQILLPENSILQRRPLVVFVSLETLHLVANERNIPSFAAAAPPPSYYSETTNCGADVDNTTAPVDDPLEI